MSESVTDVRAIRSVSEREIAIALVLELAESGLRRFSLLGFYDDDAEFIQDVADRLNVRNDKPFDAKLTRVVRCLVNYGVLRAQMHGTHKEYFGEPTKQMEYSFMKPGKARLLTQPKSDFTMGPQGEAEFLIRHAYPNDED